MARKKPQIIFLYLMLPAIFIIFIYSLIFAKFSNVSQPYIKYQRDPGGGFAAVTILSEISTSNGLGDDSLPPTAAYTKRPHPASSTIIRTGEEFSRILKLAANDTRLWDESLEERFRQEKKSEKRPKFPLKVIIVPHSHNDPGWLNTYDQYFYHYTYYVLENLVKNLNKHPNMTFVWAEMSFFSRWWDSLSSSKMKDNLRKLLAERRLEIVTGGWVMSDEGPAHYFDMIDQLVEGHQFLRTNLKYRNAPPNGWSVDPFGHSATFGYLLHKSGIANIYIQRTHYAWKKYLSMKRYLEFFWKQPHQDEATTTSLPLCHMSPLHLYSFKYACGPDHRVCLEYDFRKIFGEHSESTAIALNWTNIDRKAKKIWDQYSKLGSLFPHNVALVLLGDDFRYNFDIEWQQQYRNYMFLMEYINSRGSEFNDTQIQFGTMEDYFRAVDERIPIGRENYPTIEGDFIPYADSYVESSPNYWTGYFTTRPYFKRLSRELQHWLRSTEIAYTLTRNHVRQHGKHGSTYLMALLERDYSVLTDARQNLALFQHHDGITGTSKDYVMEDYGRRLGNSINSTMQLFAKLIQYLNFNERSAADRNNTGQFIFPAEDKPDWIRVTERKILKIPADSDGLKVLVFNSLTQTRTESIRILADDPFVLIYDVETGQKIPFQINPVFVGPSTLSSSVFEIEFFDQLAPLSLKNYRISTNEESLESKVTIVMLDDDSNGNENKLDQSNEAFVFEQNRGIQLENNFMVLTFDTKGFIEKIHFKWRNVTEYVRMYFLAYTPEPKRSGAYLLKFDKRVPERMMFVTETPSVHLVQGQLSSSITVNYSDVAYTIKLFNGNDSVNGAAIELKLFIDLQNKPQYDDQEIALRIETGIQNSKPANKSNHHHHRTFYVDSNGFQIFERRFVDEIGIEGNYYPMTSTVFIEDDQWRFTVLASHSHGATSPRDGTVEIMLDRRITLDDKRGLSEGVMDNLPVESSFWLLFEERSTSDENLSSSPSLPVLTELAEQLLAAFSYPPSVLYAYRNEQEMDGDGPYYRNRYLISPHTPLCRYFLLNLRTLPQTDNFARPSSSSLMILHHRASRPSGTFHVKNCDIDQNHHQPNHHHRHHHHRNMEPVAHLFNDVRIGSIRTTGLTGLASGTEESLINSVDDLAVPLFDIVSYNVTFL